MFEENEQPLVSIITPVFNGSKYIEQLIESVLQQDYPRIEHIIIDDGSNDDGATVGVLQRYPHLRWWTRENKGQYATLNEGLQAATGEVFTTISADDWYHDPTAIGAMIDLWREHPHYDGVCGRLLRVDEFGNRLAWQRTAFRWPKWVIYYTNYLPHSAALIDRNLLVAREVVFDQTLRYCGDMDWAIQLHRKKFRLYFTSKLVANYRWHESQMVQSEGGEAVRQERRRLAEKYHLNPLLGAAVACTCRWLVRVSYLTNDYREGGISQVFSVLKAKVSSRRASRAK